MVITILLLGVAIWFIYSKIFVMYSKYFFYKAQSIQVVGFPLPFFGNYFSFKKSLRNLNHQKQHQLPQYYLDNFGSILPNLILDFRFSEGILMINDVNIVQNLLTVNDVYLDKHSKSRNLSYHLMGDSILFTPTTPKWKQKRQSLGIAFYKSKMMKMLEQVADMTKVLIKEWQNNSSNTEFQINLIRAFADHQQNCVAACIFGIDKIDDTLPYEEKGNIQDLKIGYFFRKLNTQTTNRSLRPWRILFSFLDRVDITPHDKEVARNANLIRNYFFSLIHEKRELQKKTGQVGNDFVSIMINEQIFMEDDKAIVDECITFFSASIQSVSVAISNVLYFLIVHSKPRQKLRAEIRDLVNTHKQDLFSLNSQLFLELSYLNMCIKEGLRLDPPFKQTSNMKLIKQVQAGEYTIRNDHIVQISILSLHLNPEQWIDPHSYIPERFDCLNPYYLTPSGKKRNPFSFLPFFGGQRVCIGKAFSEYVTAIVVALIVGSVEFNFIDENNYRRKLINANIYDEPLIMAAVSSVDLNKI